MNIWLDYVGLKRESRFPVRSGPAKSDMRKHIEPSEIIPCQFPSGKGFKPIIGATFDRLKVLSHAGKLISKTGKNIHLWSCLCDCGKTLIVRSGHLRSGHTRSCGCRKIEGIFSRVYKDGRSHTTEYSIWRDMIRRCENPKRKAWPNYGGRGIKVCGQWKDFETFFGDMGPRPFRCSIERKDGNGDYTPDNCFWATRKQQNRNKRNNRLIEFNGQTRCSAEWDETLGLPRNTISQRLFKGWSIERSLTEPVRKCVRISVQ